MSFMQASFLALFSGIIGAYLTQLFTLWREDKNRKKEFINNQIKFLYGPLFTFVKENEVLITHVNYIDGLCETNKVKNYVSEEFSKVLDVQQDFYKKVVLNNIEMIEIIKNNFFLIEKDDITIFMNFILLRNRSEIEFEKDTRKYRMPTSIGHELPKIILLPDDFKELIIRRFNEKKT